MRFRFHPSQRGESPSQSTRHRRSPRIKMNESGQVLLQWIYSSKCEALPSYITVVHDSIKVPRTFPTNPLSSDLCWTIGKDALKGPNYND